VRKMRAANWMVCVVVGLSILALPRAAEANHPVLVEGNGVANGPAGATNVPPGTGGDFDGDGLVGVAEDTDNATDRIFGTLTAALLAANGGANTNGHVIIVTSGRFAERIRIPNAPSGQPAVAGTLVIEAAPGVQANIDAVLAGDPGGAQRQADTGVIIDTQETNRTIILRNLVIRNFLVGMIINGNSRVTMEKCRFDSNLNANLVVDGNARLTMTDCSINAAGQRFNPMPGTPGPGHGIIFMGTSSGSIANSTISGNTATGIVNSGSGEVRLLGNNIFDNGRDLQGRFRTRAQEKLGNPMAQ